MNELGNVKVRPIGQTVCLKAARLTLEALKGDWRYVQSLFSGHPLYTKNLTAAPVGKHGASVAASLSLACRRLLIGQVELRCLQCALPFSSGAAEAETMQTRPNPPVNCYRVITLDAKVHFGIVRLDLDWHGHEGGLLGSLPAHLIMTLLKPLMCSNTYDLYHCRMAIG